MDVAEEKLDAGEEMALCSPVCAVNQQLSDELPWYFVETFHSSQKTFLYLYLWSPAFYHQVNSSLFYG